MNDADRNLLQRALDRISGRDPVAESLSALVQEHGREAVAKAAADLEVAPEAAWKTGPADELEGLTEEQAQELLAEIDGAAQDEAPAWFKPFADRLEKLEGGSADGESAGDGREDLPQDELDLVAKGVPVQLVKQAAPMLRSTDEAARRAAFEFVAKQANPANRVLLGKEAGSSHVPEDGERTPAELAFAKGENPRVTANGSAK